MSDSKLLLVYPEQINPSYFAEFRDAVSDLSEERTKPMGPVNGIDWLMPTVVTVLIAKPFLDALTKKAADEFAEYAYPKMKAAIKSLAVKIFLHERLPFVKVTRDGPSEDDSSHILFSIRCGTRLEHKVKFVFEKTYTEEEYDELIDSAFESLSDHHLAEGYNDQLSRQIEEMPDPKFTTIPMTYDTDKNTWVVRDPIGDKRDGG